MTIPRKNIRRILAHRVIYNDREYALSVVTITDGRVTDISAFERETPGTEFISGTIRIIDDESGLRIINESGLSIIP